MLPLISGLRIISSVAIGGGIRSVRPTAWNEEKGYSEVIIDLPQGEYAGKSMIIEFYPSLLAGTLRVRIRT